MPSQFNCSDRRRFFPTEPSTSQLTRWDSDEKMDEIPDDEKFLKRMQDSEYMQISERQQRASKNLAAGGEINPFTSTGIRFFGRADSRFNETIFNPASCLRETINKQWCKTRRILCFDEEDTEVEDSEKEEDEPMQVEDDLDEGLLDLMNTGWSVGNEDSEEKKMLKRKNPDGGDDGGCKDAKRVFDKKDPEEFDYMETKKQKDSEDPEEKKTLKRKNEDEEECKEAKRRYMDLYLL